MSTHKGRVVKAITVTVALLSVLIFCGCESIAYYSQAVSGQMSIISKREDIDDVIKAEDTDALLKQRLQQVQQMRAFAEQQLQLPVDDSYSSYVDIERDYVVWNVYAAEAFSLTPKTWCFPVAGCVAYKGYFTQEPAVKKAKQLQDEGMDIHVAGIRAYSTLGWFDDPILNTFINDDALDLAALLFHELAHRQLYIKNDTAFNESFATAVSDIGLQQWLQQQGLASNSTLDDGFKQHLQKRDRHRRVIALLIEYRARLAAVYSDGDLTNDQKLEQKRGLLAELNQDYQALKPQLATDRYDQWMETMNNAKLATVANYNGLVPAFKQLYISSGEDISVFYEEAKKLAELEKNVRHERLQSMMDGH